MSLNLSLTEAEEAALAAKARAQGTTPEALVREVIEPLFGGEPEQVQVQAGECPRRDIGEERFKALRQAFEGFSDEEMMILDGIILEPARH